MHVQQTEAEASGKWVKAAPRNRTCNNTTTHHKRSTCKFSASQLVCVCWCCCAISCKDVAEEAAIAAAATSSPQCLSFCLSLSPGLCVCVCEAMRHKRCQQLIVTGTKPVMKAYTPHQAARQRGNLSQCTSCVQVWPKPSKAKPSIDDSTQCLATLPSPRTSSQTSSRCP